MKRDHVLVLCALLAAAVVYTALDSIIAARGQPWSKETLPEIPAGPVSGTLGKIEDHALGLVDALEVAERRKFPSGIVVIDAQTSFSRRSLRPDMEAFNAELARAQEAFAAGQKVEFPSVFVDRSVATGTLRIGDKIYAVPRTGTSTPRQFVAAQVYVLDDSLGTGLPPR